MIRVAIRFDDPSPTSNRALELALLAVLTRAGARATFAAVPFANCSGGQLALDTNSAAHLIDASRRGVIEVAQHGCRHRNAAPVDTMRSEFHGLAGTEQERLIVKGATCLRGLFGTDSVTGFVPPWNSHDAQMLPILVRKGFAYLSAGVSHATYRADLPLLPRTCQFANIEAAVTEARRHRYADPHVIAVLHHFDFVEHGSDDAKLSIAAFEDRLAWLTGQSDVSLMTLRQMAAGAPAIIRRWPLRAQSARWLPWRLRHRLPRHCIVGAPLWRQLLRSPSNE